jgi:hypothetical protein
MENRKQMLDAPAQKVLQGFLLLFKGSKDRI